MISTITNNICNIIKIIYIITLLIVIYVAFSLYDSTNSEPMINIKPLKKPVWKRNECKYILSKTMDAILSEYNITNAEENPDLIIPCTYDEINKEIDMIDPKDDQRIYIIHNADYLAAKDYLWRLIVQKYGLEKAKTIMPNTYVTYLDYDMDRFDKEYSKDKLYIMKKNVQRQTGIKITDSYDDIIETKSDYIVIQELLQNPYIIDGRKINMRFYVLVVCQNDNIDVYVYNDGFMYYTKDKFIKNSTDMDPNITTGYVDRSVYDKNPLTHGDYRKYLDKTRDLNEYEKILEKHNVQISAYIFNKVYALLRDVMISSLNDICSLNKLKKSITFQLFGVDVAISDNLHPYIMEINKGPDMSGKDERDYKLKSKCVMDMLSILGLIKMKSNNDFIKIVDKENDKIKGYDG